MLTWPIWLTISLGSVLSSMMLYIHLPRRISNLDYPPWTPIHPQNVVVIGAGASGINTAYSLHKLLDGDVNITILEWEDRIGGRIFDEDCGGHTVEVGAAFVHGLWHNPLWKMVRR